MNGPTDLIQALEDPDRYGTSYVRSQLTTLLPQTRAITGIIEKSRQVAGELVKMQNPGLIGQAMQDRRSMLVNGRTAQ